MEETAPAVFSFQERRHMRKRRWERAAAAALFFFCSTGAVFSAYVISGPSGGSVSLIPISGVTCHGEMTASPQLINTGEQVNFRLKPGKDPGSFTARAKTHNGTARYSFDGVARCLIVAEGKEYLGESAAHRFSAAGIHEVKGYITFRWKTSKEKINAGYPPYYFRTLILSQPVRVTDLSQATDDTQQEKEETGKEQDKEGEEIQPLLISGKVSHTEAWEKNRQRFNAFCQEEGLLQWIRPPEIFWSGEKFVLSAVTTGEEEPDAVSVSILGTGYETALHRENGMWRGELFDRTMINKWGSQGREELVFLFRTEAGGDRSEDRQSVFIDDRQPYWLMHRKE